MLPFPNLGLTASHAQTATYFFAVCLSSITFLVFLNSAISFVITDRIGDKNGVGNAVGTLGFADELVALVCCPLWGVLSDRIGLRNVVVLGYSIVAMGLFAVVAAGRVYPDLLVARMGFAVKSG